MRVLITGGTGFIGQHLLEEIVADDFFVRIVTRKNVSSLWTKNRRFETCIADISNGSQLERAFQGSIDVIVNLAAEKSDLLYFDSTNVAGVENLIGLSKKYGVKKIIHLSSISVFGMKYSRTKKIIDNNFYCIPTLEYGITKLKSESLLKDFGKKNNTEIIILRSSAVFGEHQPSRYLLDLFQRVKTGIAIPRCRETTANYVYVKDVAHAVRYFLKNKTGSQTLTVGESVPFTQFLSFVAEPLSASIKIKFVPSFVLALLEMINYFGISNLRKKFQAISNRVEYDDSYMKQIITYKYGLKQGIENTIKSYTTEICK